MNENKKQSDMKQKLIAIALLLTLGTSANFAAPKHRHHAATEQVVVKQDSTDEDEVVAYSDTTSVAEDDDEWTTSTPTTRHRSINPDDYDNPFSWLESLSLSTGGIFVACLVLLVILLIALSPFILLALLLRFIIKRHNDRITLAEKAMETGQPIPEGLKSIDKHNEESVWSSGVRNVAVGAGMIIMFWIWHSTMLSGLGALVLCYGIGQMVIARTTDRNKKNEDDII